MRATVSRSLSRPVAARLFDIAEALRLRAAAQIDTTGHGVFLMLRAGQHFDLQISQSCLACSSV